MVLFRVPPEVAPTPEWFCVLVYAVSMKAPKVVRLLFFITELPLSAGIFTDFQIMLTDRQ